MYLEFNARGSKEVTKCCLLTCLSQVSFILLCHFFSRAFLSLAPTFKAHFAAMFPLNPFNALLFLAWIFVLAFLYIITSADAHASAFCGPICLQVSCLSFLALSLQILFLGSCLQVSLQLFHFCLLLIPTAVPTLLQFVSTQLPLEYEAPPKYEFNCNSGLLCARVCSLHICKRVPRFEQLRQSPALMRKAT